MFAGKSEELMRLVRRAHLAGMDVAVVSHALDDRHGTGEVASHAGTSIPALTAGNVDELRSVLAGAPRNLVAIDEAQFFGPDLVPVVNDLLERGTVVVIAGLSVTLGGDPFSPLPELMAVAEKVRKLTAVCIICGEDAAFHQRLVGTEEADAHASSPSLVGGAESYQARCRQHFEPPS